MVRKNANHSDGFNQQHFVRNYCMYVVYSISLDCCLRCTCTSHTSWNNALPRTTFKFVQIRIKQRRKVCGSSAVRGQIIIFSNRLLCSSRTHVTLTITILLFILKLTSVGNSIFANRDLNGNFIIECSLRAHCSIQLAFARKNRIVFFRIRISDAPTMNAIWIDALCALSGTIISRRISWISRIMPFKSNQIKYALGEYSTLKIYNSAAIDRIWWRWRPRANWWT